MNDQKVLKITVDSEIIEMFEWLDKNKGMSRQGAIRMGLKALCKTDEQRKKEEEEKAEKEKPLPEEVQKDLDEYMANPTEHFCINHPNILQSKCECFTNGNILQGLLRFHGYPHKTKYD